MFFIADKSLALTQHVNADNGPPLIYFHNFQDLHMHAISPVQQAGRKAYIQQIEILHYIDFDRKKEDLNTVV